jgi:hypothetical protein
MNVDLQVKVTHVWGNKDDEADSKRRKRRGRLRLAKGRPRIQSRRRARKGGESKQCSVRHLVEHFETRFLKFYVDSRRFLCAPPPSVSSLIVFPSVSRHPCYRLPQQGHKATSSSELKRICASATISMWHWRLALATVANTLLLFIRRIEILFSPEPSALYSCIKRKCKWPKIRRWGDAR